MDASYEESTPSQRNESKHTEESPAGICTPKHDNNQPNRNEANLTQLKELFDFILHHLSTSSNETLLLVLVCLVGATYVLLGRLGLLLIGLASGVVLHASWEGVHHNAADNPLNSSKKRELALHVANRLLDWPKRHFFEDGAEHNGMQTIEDMSPVETDYSTFRPQTAAALNSLTEAIMNGYVNHWYGPILPSETTFPRSCQTILTSFIASVSSHISRKRTADTFLEFLTNSSSMVIVFLNELSTAFETVGSSKSPEETVQQYLELFPESSLANVLADQQQRKKLNLIADDVLSNFLDSKAYECPPLRDFLREILAGVILESTVSSLSRPDFINGWIIHLFSEGGSEIMSAIDAGVEGAKNQGVTTANSPSDVTTSSAVTNETDLGSKLSFEVAEERPNHTDKATKDAIIEAKRLSAMIAAQDLQGQPPDQTIESNPQSLATPSYSDILPNGSGIKHDGNEHSFDKAVAQETMSSELYAPATERVVKSDTAKELSSSSPPPPTNPPLNQHLRNSSSPPSLTLYGATISVDDGSEPSGQTLLRSKPTSNYLLQIEPASTRCTGWMVFRNYADFENLHETLSTISRLNQIQRFSDNHPVVPTWKSRTKQVLATNLEQYLQDALQYESLAESERMRRFLEKDGPLSPAPTVAPTKSGFSFPSQVAFENVGKGVLGVLANAPKGVSDGSKTIFDGVTGVFGAGPGKKPSISLSSNNRSHDASSQPNGLSLERPPDAKTSSTRRVSLGLEDDMKVGSSLSPKDQRYSSAFESSPTDKYPTDAWPLRDGSFDSLQDTKSRSDNADDTNPELPGRTSSGPENYNLPEMPRCSNETKLKDSPMETGACQATIREQCTSGIQNNSITQEETHMAVELIFAVINELYTLSSAWNIRRTLLNAAKSYILRPGNPNLETIRGLLQESMIDANTSDEALGSYLLKIRENALPTEAELRNWPPPPNGSEKERLRETARRVLVQRGLPQALTSVMGAAASREALEKIFDCLQVEDVARGFVFSIFLQALRAVFL